MSDKKRARALRALAGGAAGLEHYERLCAMRDDEEWDLFGSDRTVFAWALEQIDGHAATLAAEREGTAKRCLAACLDVARELSQTGNPQIETIGVAAAEDCAAAISSLLQQPPQELPSERQQRSHHDEHEREHGDD